MDQINSGSAYNSLNSSVLRQQTSMSTLISWNIAKAVEANPNINLKTAIKVTHQRLKTDTRDVSTVVSQKPEDQYLACALLAWQQLGHNEAESLYEFVEKKLEQSSVQDNTPRSEDGSKTRRPMLSPGSFISYEDSTMSRGVGSSNYDSYSLVGPVVKLPVETKIVMRLDNTPSQRQTRRKAPEKDLMNKIDAACCMESACIEKLSQLDRSTAEMRVRAERLARREAERVELLERAEAAWKDLERGYQRRLAMAEEKEEDMAKHIKKLIEERNGYKNACTTLAQTLRQRGEVAEKERAQLTQVEKEMCESACMRLRMSEEAAKLDAALAEQQCKGSQFDRDLQFKEEQIRRKLQAMESELESARCLTHEVERALHAELSALRAQVTKVSHQLLEEDAETAQIKEQLEVLRQEKMEMVEDLDGCKVLCDGRIQGKMDALKQKKEQLNQLREQVMECQCKMPVDASVEAKRTPSLAALCKCSPEDKYLDSCSCTSLRSSLLSNLLADLFSGLQAELGGCGSQMPCQLLKCLEDRHNWDKSSIVKTNLRNYFSQLLIGELDIAIATSIEKYHAKWVGASCADAARMIPERGGAETEGWQERALERRAQKLAAKLAEQLFQERADQLTAKAKEIVRTGPPPCECRPAPTAVYPVLVNQPVISRQAPAPAPAASNGAASPAYWRRTQQDVTQLKVQLEDLKKDSIKKEDLKVMEENIVKLVQRATVTDDANVEPVDESLRRENDKNAYNIHRSVNTEASKNNVCPKLSSIKKKQSDLSPKKGTKNFVLGLQIDKPVRSFRNVGRSYAVNMCLCSSRKDSKKISRASEVNDVRKPLKGVPNIISPVSSVKQTKPTACKPSKGTGIVKKSKTGHLACQSGVICFHKPPSNTSIDKLLETLAKWKCDLSQLDNKNDDSKDMAVASELKIKSSYQTLPSKVSKNLSALPFRSKVIVANVSTSVPGGMPINTESEYMGTINLESGSANREQVEDNIFKCIHSEIPLKDFQDENNLCNKTHNMIHKSLTLATTENNIPALVNKTKSNEPNIVQQENTPNIGVGLIPQPSSFTNDSQYCIKFLGVTLTNASSRKKIPERDPIHKNERRVIIDTNHKRKTNHPQVWYNNVHNKCLHKPDIPVNVPNKQMCMSNMPACDCSLKHDEVKNTPKAIGVKHHGDFNKNEDKSMDTHSLKILPESECCVCCVDKLDDSKDLEVNAFHLLEKHLREKMEEFKAVNCKSTCIRPEEEERLFSTILNKVKQIITENTGDITCKCNPIELVEGSWHRAYILLEEYLKIKIKKVSCLCLSTEKTNSNVLPDILEKVCTLIDDDFKRLKKMCKCKNADSNFVYETEFPEKDSSDFTYNNNNKQENYTLTELKEVDKTSKQISNNSILQTQDTSSQMSPIRDMDTKSCDAIEIKTQNEHTSNIFANKCCKITDISYDHNFRKHSTKITKSFNKLFGSNDLTINQCANIQDNREIVTPVVNIETELGQGHDFDVTEKHKNIMLSGSNDGIKGKDELTIEADIHQEITNVQKKTPYIGYTIDCSCDEALGACSCTKSLIKGKGDNINSIWNTLTSNKLRHNDISYIMDGIANKKLTEKEKNLDELKITDNTQPVVKSTCDLKTGALYWDEIVLKDSNDRLNKQFKSNTTSGEDIMFTPDDCSNSTKHKTLIMADFSDNTCEDSLYYPVGNIIYRGKSTGLIKSDPIHLPTSFSSDCDCNMVPMCHVKMLVENIENKLIHSKCTCDSLCSKVCPVHSKKQLL